MTYCIGVLLDQGMIFASDSRTNAGLDDIGRFCKMTLFERRQERVIVLLSSGNLAGTQAVIGVLNQRCGAGNGDGGLWGASTMFDVAMLVADAMRDIVREMRAAPPFNSLILDEAEIFGVDKFGDSSLLIKGRVRCTPFGRWQVGREFNRRVKAKFEELGIEMPYPHLKLVLDGDVLTTGVGPRAASGHGAEGDEAPAAG